MKNELVRGQKHFLGCFWKFLVLFYLKLPFLSGILISIPVAFPVTETSTYQLYSVNCCIILKTRDLLLSKILNYYDGF